MKTVEAAGAVVLRRAEDRGGGERTTGQPGRGDRQEVVLVHRPSYDDWSLPKGKLEAGELLPTAAVREVGEETLTRIVLGSPLDRTTHQSGKSTRKRVSWWRGTAVGSLPAAEVDHDHDGTPEVDEISWLPVDRAEKRLSYDQDREVLAQSLEQPVTTPLIIVRHAKAVNRKDWDGTDAERPVRPRGRVQSRRLVPLLTAYGVSQLFTSPWQRCISTLQPYALHTKITSTRLPILNEDEGSDDPAGVAAAMDAIREQTVVGHTPTVVCGHRPVLPHMLAALDLPTHPLSTAECVVLHLTDVAEVHAVEYHRPRA